MSKTDSAIKAEIYKLSASQLLERWSSSDPLWSQKYRELVGGAVTNKLVEERFLNAHVRNNTLGLIEFENEHDPNRKEQLFSELSLAEMLTYLSRLSK